MAQQADQGSIPTQQPGDAADPPRQQGADPAQTEPEHEQSVGATTTPQLIVREWASI